MDDDAFVFLGDAGGPAQMRAWIRAQLAPDETLRCARPVVDTSSQAWRVWERTKGYAVVTSRRVFVAALSGTSAKARRRGYADFQTDPPRIIREALLQQIERFPRHIDPAVWLRFGNDERKLRFRSAADASDFEKALSLREGPQSA